MKTIDFTQKWESTTKKSTDEVDMSWAYKLLGWENDDGTWN